MKHFIEGFLGFCGDLWVDGDFGLFGLEGFESRLQVIFFHVEAEVAEAVEFFVGEGLFEAFVAGGGEYFLIVNLGKQLGSQLAI